MSAHITLSDAAARGLVTPETLAAVEARHPGHELLLTTPEATAGGWWRAWARRRRPDGTTARVNAPWVSHDPERAARALLGERRPESDRRDARRRNHAHRIR